jgi:hypothetical protein
VSAPVVDGVVLCRVGGARLALSCHEVEHVAELPQGPIELAVAFGEPAPAEGRALCAAGRFLRVESVDVLATPGLAVLPVPAALSGLAGGALTGFVELAGQLWPLASARGLVEWLTAGPRA